jgi:UDP-N-acetylmuramoylalanine--D-glutamate ligase
MSEYHNARVSPHVAVFTTEVPFDIIEYQTYNNFIVAPDSVIDVMRNKENIGSKAKMLRTKSDNISLATQAAQLFKVDSEISEKVIAEFSGLKGHQELIKKLSGVEYYNDSSSIHPISTISAMTKLSINKNVVLILGGAYTGCDYDELIKNIPEYAHVVILLPGSGSIGIRADLELIKGVKFFQAPTIDEALAIARENAKKGDRVLFSPGYEAIGAFVSRKDRGEKFVKAVRAL